MFIFNGHQSAVIGRFSLVAVEPSKNRLDLYLLRFHARPILSTGERKDCAICSPLLLNIVVWLVPSRRTSTRMTLSGYASDSTCQIGIKGLVISPVLPPCQSVRPR